MRWRIIAVPTLIAAATIGTLQAETSKQVVQIFLIVAFIFLGDFAGALLQKAESEYTSKNKQSKLRSLGYLCSGIAGSLALIFLLTLKN